MSDDATATDTPTTAEPDEGHNWIEILAAALLGLAAILTAYAAYNGALASDQVLEGFTKSSRHTADANGAYTEYMQAYTSDQILYAQYAILRQQGDEETAEAIKTNIFSAELEEATDKWLELSPEEQEATLSPIFSDFYPTTAFDSYTENFELAETEFADAQKIDDQADNYDLGSVYLAVALFFAGIAALFKTRRIQILMLIGSAALIVPGVQAIAKGKGWL
jgi:hypothetical protein